MVLFYEIILMIIAIAVLMGFMTHGFKKGAAAEISSLFSVLFALLILYLLTTAWNNFMTEHLGAIFSTILMIVIVVLAYKLLHIFFAGINILAKLPVINWLDKGLGFVVGIIEGFVVLYILEYLLIHYLLKIRGCGFAECGSRCFSTDAAV